MTRAADHLEKAVIGLLVSNPFFGALAAGLERVESDRFPTMATDGRRLYFNPAWTLSLSDAECRFVVAHEIEHCALSHHTRRGHRDARRWNEAADYCINGDLAKLHGMIMPKGGLIDSRFDGLGAEEVFRLLDQAESAKAKQQAGKPAQDPGQGNGNGSVAQDPGQGNAGGKTPSASASGAGKPGEGQGAGAGLPATSGDPGACGEILDAAPGHDGAGMEAARADWETRVRQAAAVAKAQGAGKLPGEVERIIAELNRPRVDWRDVLRRFIDQSASQDYSWSRPNRRHIAAGLYLPGLVPDRPGHIVNVVDVSGSMDESALASLGGELQGQLDEGAADRLTVVYADTRVRRVETYEAGDTVRLVATGGGGTAFRDSFRWIADNAPDASAVLYLTDCDVTDWGEQPAAPVLWIVTGHPRRARELADKAPFGEAIILGD